MTPTHIGTPFTCDGHVIEWLCRLDVYAVPGSRNVFLAHPWGANVDGVDYVAPGDMETDGVSAGRLLWRVLDPPIRSLLFPGACIHDAAYGGILLAVDQHGNELTVDRTHADWLLSILGRANGYGRTKGQVVHVGITALGWPRWNELHTFNAQYIDRTKWEYRWQDFVTPERP